MAFNRDRNHSRPSGGGFRSRPSFGDKQSFSSSRPRFSDRGPVEMHRAVCDNCGKECEVPFRPTQGKPVYCSNCFENQRGGSDSARFERRDSGRSEERQMFDAVCADCGNNCKVPFMPSSDKPVFCSNCFGSKKEGGGPRPQTNDSSRQLEELNSKLDRILKILESAVTEEATAQELKAKPKAVKKSSSKKKV